MEEKKQKPISLPKVIKVPNREEPLPVIQPQHDRTSELQFNIDRLEAENKDITERLKIVEQQLKTKSTQLKKLQAKHDELT